MALWLMKTRAENAYTLLVMEENGAARWFEITRIHGGFPNEAEVVRNLRNVASWLTSIEAEDMHDHSQLENLGRMR